MFTLDPDGSLTSPGGFGVGGERWVPEGSPEAGSKPPAELPALFPSPPAAATPVTDPGR